MLGKRSPLCYLAVVPLVVVVVDMMMMVMSRGVLWRKDDWFYEEAEEADELADARKASDMAALERRDDRAHHAFNWTSPGHERKLV